jgi:hypothetical protein
MRPGKSPKRPETREKATGEVERHRAEAGGTGTQASEAGGRRDATKVVHGVQAKPNRVIIKPAC